MADFEFEHTETTTADADAVWTLWADVTRWTEWDSSLDRVELAGAFAAGGEGTMTMPGRPAITFRITEVEPGRSFTDETEVPGAVLRFQHVLNQRDGHTEVTHRVEIDGDPALGPFITADVPQAVRALVQLAEASSRT